MASTIKDIARKLNISVSTVSYALNGGPRSVPSHVAEQVAATAKELNYRPNRLARSLVSRRSNVLGIVPTAISHNMAIGPYFVQMLNGIVNAGELLGQDVLICTKHSSTDSPVQIEQLIDGRVDGLIFIAPVINSEAIRQVAELKFPHVVISGESHVESLSFTLDNDLGVKLIVDHLVEMGHTKIGHITGSLEQEDGILRERAFRNSMASHRLPVREDWIVEGGFTPSGGTRAAEIILNLSDRPTAIFCANDEMALSLVLAARKHGIKIPHQLAIAGFDDTFFSHISNPPLTTVEQPMAELASEATQALVRLIEGSSSIKCQKFAPKLIARESTTLARPV